MNKSVYHFAPQDVEDALEVLNTAIENHRIWFDRLHTSIVCEQPFSKDILDDAAHKHCEFGKWYYSKVNNSIKSVSEFSKIEVVHKYMHSYARDMAVLSMNNQKINPDEYQGFLSNQRNLIKLLSELRDTITEHGYSIDAVTGAVNRRSIIRFLEQSYDNFKRYDQVYSLAMVDLDYFKKVNDQYGHVVGDQVLKNVCQIFQHKLRKSDCIGRYGGEEFLFVLPGTDEQDAYKQMDKIRSYISSESLHIDDLDINISVSIGISEVNSSDEEAMDAVRRADTALYQAKQSGRNCINFL